MTMRDQGGEVLPGLSVAHTRAERNARAWGKSWGFPGCHCIGVDPKACAVLRCAATWATPPGSIARLPLVAARF